MPPPSHERSPVRQADPALHGKPVVPEHRRDRRPGVRPLTRTEAEELYGFHRWGAGYFSVGENGELRVHPTAEPGLWVSLPAVLETLAQDGSEPPVTLRFPQIIRHQLERLHRAFKSAIQEFDYAGAYQGVFPIKVNQMRPFLRELVAHSKDFAYGLEAGTKPELALALAAGLAPGSLILGNGYKDREYIELALAGVTLGQRVILVVEKLHELDLILDVAEEIGVRPELGIRLKIHARGTGKWEKSGGAGSKFGLNTVELLRAIEDCRERGWADRIKLLHFHIGSQITDVRRIKQGVEEGARFYAAVRRAGIDIEFLDVGGGLGVDYDGSRTSTDSSVNYTLQEYANDVVYAVQAVCQETDVPAPTLVSESGRAVSAYHAMAIFSVEEQQTVARRIELPELGEDADRCVTDLVDSLAEIGPKNYAEIYHDTLELMNQAHMLFKLGRLSLEERAVAEAISGRIFADVVYFSKVSGRRVPEEIEELEQLIAIKYVVNMSIFQTMPDHWALGQLFPIAPIHRLDERPSVWATLADITCDSDGKVDRFGGVREDHDAIRLHELRGEPYHLGGFLLGAYQDVMGDYHNLLGEVAEARVVVSGPGEAEVTRVPVSGQTSGDLLDLFGYPRAELRAQIEAALPPGASAADGERALAALNRVLETTPYLT